MGALWCGFGGALVQSLAKLEWKIFNSARQTLETRRQTKRHLTLGPLGQARVAKSGCLGAKSEPVASGYFCCLGATRREQRRRALWPNWLCCLASSWATLRGASWGVEMWAPI